MRTTKPFITFVILASSLALAFAANARAGIISPFIRAGVDFSKLNGIQNIGNNSISWKDKLSGWDAGYFAEAGITFLGSHTLAVEAGYMKASSSLADDESGIKSREQIPLLLNYRHTFNLGPASLYLGLSAGMMSDTASWQKELKDQVGSWGKFKSANWVALYGATAGVGLKLGKHWGLDIGVRALAVNEKEYQAGALSSAETSSYSIGSAKIYIRPNVRLAISRQW